MRTSMRCFESFFKHTWRPQQVHRVMMTSLPGSMWDYPNQSASLIMYSMFNTPVELDLPRRDPPFPSKNRIPKVDSPSRFEPAKLMKTMRMPQHAAGGETTELGEVVISSATSSTVATAVHPSDVASCKNGGCKSWRGGRTEQRAESPWHLLKTIFLVSVIVAFLLWIIVYTLLDQYRIL